MKRPFFVAYVALVKGDVALSGERIPPVGDASVLLLTVGIVTSISTHTPHTGCDLPASQKPCPSVGGKPSFFFFGKGARTMR